MSPSSPIAVSRSPHRDHVSPLKRGGHNSSGYSHHTRHVQGRARHEKAPPPPPPHNLLNPSKSNISPYRHPPACPHIFMQKYAWHLRSIIPLVAFLGRMDFKTDGVPRHRINTSFTMHSILSCEIEG